MTEPSLKADCQNCAALCCMALAFDKSEMFAIDKQAGQACPNLGPDHRCTIHSDLKIKGFQGCINYDCEGAGQRVTAMYSGRSWQAEPALMISMLEAFHAMRQVHQRLVLLSAAQNLPLDMHQTSTLHALQEKLSDAHNWLPISLAKFPQSDTAKDIQTFLISLAPHVRDKSIEHRKS
jgi:hypothetical protein